MLLAAALAVTGTTCGWRESSLVGVSPSRHTEFLFPGSSSEVELNVDVKGLSERMSPLDVLLVFDHTASMGNVIGVMRNAADTLLNSIATMAPDSRFGVGLIADYPLYSPNERGTVPWELAQDLTADHSAISSALARVRLRDGGDLPEAYTRGFYEAAGVNWRAGAQKFIIFFGDAPAHAPDFYEPGLAAEVGVDPGRDGVVGTSDDLQMTQVLQQLGDAGIKIVTIHEQPPRFLGKKPRLAEAVDGLQRVAARTHGVSKSVADAAEIPSAIESAIRETYAPTPVVINDTGHEMWARVGDLVPVPGSTTRYSTVVELFAADDAPSGIYEFPIRFAYADDPKLDEVGRSTLRVRVGWAAYDWRPAIWGLGLLLLLLPLVGPRIGQRVGSAVLFHSGAAMAWGILARFLVVALIIYGTWCTARWVGSPTITLIGGNSDSATAVTAEPTQARGQQGSIGSR